MTEVAVRDFQVEALLAGKQGTVRDWQVEALLTGKQATVRDWQVEALYAPNFSPVPPPGTISRPLLPGTFAVNEVTVATTNHVVPLPPAARPGSFLVVQGTVDGSAGSAPGGAGWQLIREALGDPSNPDQSAWAKFYTEDEEDAGVTSWTFTTTTAKLASWIIVSYEGVHPTDPFGGTVASRIGGVGDTVVAPSRDVDYEGSIVVGGCALNSTSTGRDIALASGWTYEVADMAGKRANYQEWRNPPTGPTGPQTFTTPGSGSGFPVTAWFIVLRPADPAPGGGGGGGGSSHHVRLGRRGPTHRRGVTVVGA